jgi:hypothetical protein
MSISSYSELQTAVGNWLHDDALTAIIPDFITLAEKRIEREVRCRENEAALNVVLSSGVGTIPSDYVELKYAYIDLTPFRVLERTTARKIYEQFPNRSSSGIPTMIASDNGNFIFGCYPASDYTIVGTYYKRLTGVATSWNALATLCPDLYLFASLAEAADYTNDEAQLGKWNAKYQKVLSDINMQEQAEKGSGSPLRIVLG